jgi:DNA-binding NtrC family response regulator
MVEGPADVDEQGASNPASPSRVLIVDDSPAIRKVLRRILESGGYAVMEAGSAATALELLTRERVDVVLTDLQMPECSGVELAQRIASQYPGVKVIAMSGFDSVHLANLAPELRIETTLMKPMKPEALLDAVRAALDKSQALQ